MTGISCRSSDRKKTKKYHKKPKKTKKYRKKTEKTEKKPKKAEKTEKTERYRKFKIWDCFFSVFFGFFLGCNPPVIVVILVMISGVFCFDRAVSILFILITVVNLQV